MAILSKRKVAESMLGIAYFALGGFLVHRFWKSLWNLAHFRKPWRSIFRILSAASGMAGGAVAGAMALPALPAIGVALGALFLGTMSMLAAKSFAAAMAQVRISFWDSSFRKLFDPQLNGTQDFPTYPEKWQLPEEKRNLESFSTQRILVGIYQQKNRDWLSWVPGTQSYNVNKGSNQIAAAVKENKPIPEELLDSTKICERIPELFSYTPSPRF